MAQRDAMRRSTAEFLQSGEEIQAVFGARTIIAPEGGLPLAALISESQGRFRIVAVTNQRVLLLRSGPLLRRARSMLTGLSLSRRMGPASGVRYVFELGPEKLRVGHRWFSDIETADNFLTGI
ncbi:MAG: hypothetical protein ACRDNZ_04295 [Streptosporangiaceae bacterium]